MYHTGFYLNGTSPIHRLDPRVKLAAVIVLSMVILCVKPPIVILVAAVCLCIVFAGSIPLRIIGQAVKPLIIFVGLIFFTHAFFSEGEAIALVNLPYLNISLSRNGMEEGGLVALRFLCLIVAAVILTTTTTPSRMIAAIKYVLGPFKRLHVPVDDIAVMMMLAMRLLPLLLMEKERVETAQKTRGCDLQGKRLAVRLKAFIRLTSTILLGVFRRADELALAMEARCYNRGERTAFVELSMRKTDYGIAAVLIVAGGVLLGLNSFI
ncbi:MAG: energy-coupling factor transporter transmembrane protein EcfT [Deltaproteobacteria bacterium]|nr:energy-coupling factor transporter transmembrane protein EcfT [Deltaproteobacteria bacterium]